MLLTAAAVRIVTALLEGAEDGHQDGLAAGATGAAVAVAVLAHDHRRSDRPLRHMVVEGNALLVEKVNKWLR